MLQGLAAATMAACAPGAAVCVFVTSKAIMYCKGQTQC